MTTDQPSPTTPPTTPPTSPPSTPRVGRPPREAAGEVSARILEAATALFLEKGVAATSCEAVAARAQVSKASLYSRHAGKDALFEAVIRHATGGGAPPPPLADLPQDSPGLRLSRVGRAVLAHATAPVPRELMRLFLTEARRRPDLIARVDAMARMTVIAQVSAAILPRTEDRFEDRALRDRADDLASRFLDLTFAPMILGVLTGRNPPPNGDQIDRQIAFALDLLRGADLLEDSGPPPRGARGAG